MLFIPILDNYEGSKDVVIIYITYVILCVRERRVEGLREARRANIFFVALPGRTIFREDNLPVILVPG